MLAVARVLTLSDLLDAPQTQWRYGPLLPLESRHSGRDWPVGWTPLIEARALAAELGVRRLRLKDESRNFTGSFKDRASALAVVRAADAGAGAVACASLGNAAVSMAAFAAAAGIPAYVFVPGSTRDGRLARALACGARVFRVDGTYQQAWDLCTQACERFGWYNRCCAYNPYLVEGKKTGGMELAEQGYADPPDWVAVSVGDGCTVAGIAKGLRQMRELEIIDWSPRLLGVQAASVAPIAAAFSTGIMEPLSPAGNATFAHSINVPAPRNWRKAVAAVRRSEGGFVTVTDDQIARALSLTARLTGVFAEPAAAASVAGIARAVSDGIIDRRASVVACITGGGLADLGGPQDRPEQPGQIAPDIDALAAALGQETA